MLCGSSRFRNLVQVMSILGALANTGYSQEAVDGNAIAPNLSGEMLSSGQFRVSLLGQSREDLPRDSKPENEQVKRAQAAIQGDFGIHERIQGLVQVLGDDDQEMEPMTSLETENGDSQFYYRSTKIGAKFGLWQGDYFKSSVLPYGVYIRNVSPDALESSSSRWEGGAQLANHVGLPDVGYFNIFGGIQYRDAVAYREMQLGNQYHAGVGLESAFSRLVQLSAHYRIEGQRFAPMPKEVDADSDLEASDRTLTSHGIGGGVRLRWQDMSIVAYGERMRSGHVPTMPSSTIFGIKLAYEFGAGAGSTPNSKTESTIIGDDKKAQPENADSTASAYPEMQGDIDFTKDLNASKKAADDKDVVNFEQELAAGAAKAQQSDQDPYELELDRLKAAELQAQADKDAEEVANNRKRQQELTSNYNASQKDGAKIRTQLQEEGLEITAEDANWTGLED